MKKVLLFASLSIAALSISSCSSDDDASTPASSTTNNTNTTTTTTDGSAETSLIETLVRSSCAEDGFTQSQCDCTLEKLQNAGVTDIVSYQNALQDPAVIAALTTCD